MLLNILNHTKSLPKLKLKHLQRELPAAKHISIQMTE